MKRIKSFVCIGVIGFAGCIGEVAAQTLDGTFVYDGYQYSLYSYVGQSWSQANAAAASTGLQLASVHNDTLNNMIENLVVANFGNSGGSPGIEAWLGGYNPSEEAGGPGTTTGWSWTDGSAWNYAPWAPGEPNNDGAVECYTAINRYGTSGWNDEGSGLFQIGGFVTEQSVPEGGSSLAMLCSALGLLGMIRHNERRSSGAESRIGF
jgi:hypothetical protein